MKILKWFVLQMRRSACRKAAIWQQSARDTIELEQGSDTQQITLSDDPFAQMALARTNLMAGTLQSTLDLGLQFAAEREQFGRSISKFQAIQHSLAVVTAEVAAAQRAADAGVDAPGH